MFATFGLHNRAQSSGAKTLRATKIEYHDGYDSYTMQHDIAILEVGSITQADLASTGAHPICLPSTDYHGGEAAVVSGWGSTKEGKYVEEKYSRLSLS